MMRLDPALRADILGQFLAILAIAFPGQMVDALIARQELGK